MRLKIYTDGGSRGNPGIAGGGLVVFNGDQEVHSASFFFGEKTNNEAEYLAVKKALEWLLKFSEDNAINGVQFFLDSKLVVEQLSRNWKIKEVRLRSLAEDCWKDVVALPYAVDFTHIKREQNADADLLANQAMDAATD